MVSTKKTVEEFGGVKLSNTQKFIVDALAAGGEIKKMPHNDPRKKWRWGIEHPVSRETKFIANVTMGLLKRKGIVDSKLNFVQPSLPGVR